MKAIFTAAVVMAIWIIGMSIMVRILKHSAMREATAIREAPPVVDKGDRAA